MYFWPTCVLDFFFFMLFKNQKASFFRNNPFFFSSPTLPSFLHRTEQCAPWRWAEYPPPPTPPLFTSLSCFCRLLSLRPLLWNSTYLNNEFPNPNLSHTLMWFHPMEWNLLPSSSFHIHLKSSFLKSSDFSSFAHIFPSFSFSFILKKKKKNLRLSPQAFRHGSQDWSVGVTEVCLTAKRLNHLPKTFSSDTGWTVNLFS